MTNATETTQQESDYEPFGVERQLTNLVVNKYKFTGLERDTESGLDHAWFRQYGSSFGRWLSPDPLGGDITNPQSLNRYAYVRNIPATLTDPSGLCGSGSLTYGCGLGQVAIGKGLAQFGTGSGLTSGPTCTVDGEPWPCGFAEELVQAGAAALCPGDICHGVATDTAGNNRIVQYWAFGGLAGAVNGYYAVSGPGGLYYTAEQAATMSSEWGTWYLHRQAGRQAGGSIWCAYGICSSTLHVGEPGAGRVDLTSVHGFSDLPGGASGQGWWRATNGESPGSDLAMIDNANSQLGTSFPLFTGTTSGGGRVLLYDPATQGPYECVLVGGVWSYGLDVPCH